MNNVLNYVFEHSKQTGSALLVLVALADWADAEGSCPARIAAIAQKARLSERQTRRVLHQLEAAGEIVIHFMDGRETLHGMTNRYQILMDGVTPTTPQATTGDTHDTPGVTPTTPDGMSCMTPLGCHPRHPDPFIDPDLDPLKESKDSFEESLKEIARASPSQEQLHLWNIAILPQLEMQFDRASFDTFLKGATLLEIKTPLSPFPPSPQVWVIGVRNAYARDNCEYRLGRHIKRAFLDCGGFLREAVDLEYIVLPKPPSLPIDPGNAFDRLSQQIVNGAAQKGAS